MDFFEFSTQQKNIWNLQRFYHETAISNICGMIIYDEKKEGNTLINAIKSVIQKNRALRLRVSGKEILRQYISNEEMDIDVVSFANETELDSYAESMAREPMEMTDRALCQFVIFSLDDHTGVIAKLNHLVADAWSLGLLFDEIEKEYEMLSVLGADIAEESDQGTSFIGDYLSYVRDDIEYLASDRYFSDAEYWHGKYQEKPVVTPIRLANNNRNQEIYAKRFQRNISGDLSEEIKDFCRRKKTTEAVIFESAVFLYLSSINPNNKTVTIGVPVLNRNKIEEKKTIGMFVSTMPLTVGMDSIDTTIDLLNRVSVANRELFRHQRYPYEDILTDLRKMHDFTENLFDVMVSVHVNNTKGKQGFRTRWYSNGALERPLLISVDQRDSNDTYSINVDYQSAMFKDDKEIELLLNRIEYIIRQIVDNTENGKWISEIEILPEEERTRLIEAFNDTQAEYPREKCVHELFMEQAKRTPDQTALVFEEQSFTYLQIDEMSNALAHLLWEKGIGRGDVIPFIAKRSWHVIVAMFGIMKAGGAYMPISPDYPMDRIRTMLEIADSKLVLCYGYDQELPIASIDLMEVDYRKQIHPAENVNEAEDLCYVIFTSGSTGQPKGVAITHANVNNFIHNSSNNVISGIIREDSRSIVSVTNIVFDIFVTESLLPLLIGMTIYFGNEEESMLQEKLAELIEKNGCDILQTTPTKMRNFLRDKTNLSYLRALKAIVMGGEEFPSDLYTELRKATEALIYNIYGPAETTVWSSYGEVTDAENVTIGRPIANTQIYILDEHQNLLPIGVAGELCIAGDGVGKGYLNQPELTAERFIENPYASEENGHGKVMYRTGDLARWREDGEIEYLGRIDTQVKIRGLRIELGEIESIMAQTEGIGFVAAAAKKDATGRQYLVGYYTTESEVDEKEMKKHLSEKLPKYMVPNYFMRLETMPMTPSGKTDRKNLPDPDVKMTAREYEAPVTETEMRLEKLWCEQLKIEFAGRYDDFFDLGGDSLSAITLVTRITKEFDIDISVKEFFENPQLADMAEVIDHASKAKRLTASGADSYRLLAQQEAIYAECKKNPESLIYNIPSKIPLTEGTDRERLAKAIAEVIKKHKVLNSPIVEEADGLYAKYDPNAELEIKHYDSEDAFLRPFDLSKAPLVHLGFTEDALLFDVHHIVCDGSSISILVKEISEAYAGESYSQENGHQIDEDLMSKGDAGLLCVQEIWYADYAEYVAETDFEKHLEFYREQLSYDYEPVQLPESKSGATGGISKIYEIESSVMEEVRKFAKSRGLTETMVLLGAYGILLSKYSGKADVLTGVILQNRILTDTQDMVGMFVNTLPLHLNTECSVEAYYKNLKNVMVGMYQNQDIPYLTVSDFLSLDRSAMNTAFVYQPFGEWQIEADGKALKPQFVETNTSKFDLTMEITEAENGLGMRIEINLEKYAEDLADRLAESYIQILEQLGDSENSEIGIRLDEAGLGQLRDRQISEIDILSEEERIRLIKAFNDTQAEYPREKCVHELFMEQAKRTPEQTALVFEDQEFTYRQIDEMSNALAHLLRERGVGRGDVIPLIAKRSWHVIAAMFGILKAGGAYMPISPDYPMDRIRTMLEIADCKLALCYGYDEILPVTVIDLSDVDYGKQIDSVENMNQAEDRCCIIFTSGSTGVPKAATLTHSNVGNYTYYIKNTLFAPAKQVIAATIITFDAFTQETIMALCDAKTVVLANEKQTMEPVRLWELVAKYQDSFMFMTPTKWLEYLRWNPSDSDRSISSFVAGGEVFTHDLYYGMKKLNSESKVFNIYGPTETTISAAINQVEIGKDTKVDGEGQSTGTTVSDAEVITIGRPIANTQIYILDEHQNLLPVGVAGELCIAGDGVGKGYLNQPELTVERFIDNPYATKENGHGKVLYRTGDLARWREDGEIEYLGRIDTQVKIRGLRIELGEIESIMAHTEGIGLVAVAAKKDATGRQYLVGYYTVEAEVNEKEMKKHLSEKLPKYMIPNYFMRLETMPMTPSGKTDRKNLPNPDVKMTEREYEAPVTETEMCLEKLWCEQLKIEFAGRGDDFFDLGGDSLSAITLVTRITKEFDIDISVKEFFENSQLADMAEVIDHASKAKRLTASGADSYRLLAQQEAIYAECKKKPESLIYNIPSKILLTEGTDRERLAKAIAGVIKSHKVLNSPIVEEADGLYAKYDPNAELEIKHYDSEDAFLRPFDLSKAPLVHLGFTEDALLFDVHHIVCDGSSISILVKEISEAYAGESCSQENGNQIDEELVLRTRADIPYKQKIIQKAWYADYVKYVEETDFEKHLEFYKEQLSYDYEPVQLPESKSGGTGGVSKVYEIESSVMEEVRKFAKSRGLTETMVLLGAYGILLSKYSGKADVLTGVILQNRILTDTQDMVGMFVNTLPLHLNTECSVEAYYKNLKNVMVGMYQYQDIPYLTIADRLSLDHSALNTAFVYQPFGEWQIEADGEALKPQTMETGTNKFDLTMEIMQSADGPMLYLEMNRGKYAEDLVDRLAESYIRILGQLRDSENSEIEIESEGERTEKLNDEQITKSGIRVEGVSLNRASDQQISEIDILSEEERKRLIEAFNDTQTEYSREKCVHELFMEQTKRTPDQTALVFEEQSFTYLQIDEMSNALAHLLMERGIERGDVVPFIARRSWHVIVSMLGVLKAGGAYMPISPDYPQDRIRTMLEIADCKLVLCYGYDQELPIASIDLMEVDYRKQIHPAENVNEAEDLCYVIFTSGSTGQPKGVSITHANVNNYTHNSNNNVISGIIREDSRSIVSVTNIVFDIFVTESLLPLLNGMTIYFGNEEESMLQEKLADLIEKKGCDILQTTPTKMRNFLRDKTNLSYLRALKAIVMGGEEFPSDLYTELKKTTEALIYNIYGPAETTVWSSYGEVTDAENVTIGRPIANTQIYILDEHQNLLPIGVAGELCIAGDGVGKGYLNQPELTAERFIENPYASEENGHGKVLYRTGDLARWRKDGELEYLGRIDTQVKIRGLRIELGEIESIMAQTEGVGFVAVAAKKDAMGRQYMVGYYTEEAKVDEKDMKKQLLEKLPRYMVPNYFMCLETMPMTPSGKIDRKNLPDPDVKVTERKYEAPETEMEIILCKIMAEVLQIDKFGVSDNFFDLGGDSLSAITVTAMAHEKGIEIGLQQLFDFPDVKSLCSKMSEKELAVGPKISNDWNPHRAGYEKYAKLLQVNQIDETCVFPKRELGNVLLTGATGFLGAHILDELMKNANGKIYCLVRKKDENDGHGGLERILGWYFDGKYLNEIGKRIIPIIGNIERKDLADEMPEDVRTVIHTAADVKHYGMYEHFRDVNIEGTRHVADYARRVGAELIHISTVSVCGNTMDDAEGSRLKAEYSYDETCFYIGQSLDNVYIRSKIEAERVVLDEIMNHSLKAKIIRVGNLTNRVRDYRFQPNYESNAFLKRFKMILEVGSFPDYLLPMYSEFSPVDMTAEAIVKIAGQDGNQNLFHLYSDKPLANKRMLEIINEMEIPLKVVSGDRFNRAVNESLKKHDEGYVYEYFRNDMNSDDKHVNKGNIHVMNDFTVWFLSNIGFEWNKIDQEYIRGYIEYFRKAGYLNA